MKNVLIGLLTLSILAVASYFAYLYYQNMRASQYILKNSKDMINDSEKTIEKQREMIEKSNDSIKEPDEIIEEMERQQMQR